MLFIFSEENTFSWIEILISSTMRSAAKKPYKTIEFKPQSPSGVGVSLHFQIELATV